MVRLMLGMVRTPYVIVMDDDSHVRPGWREAIARFIDREGPVDVAGKFYFWKRDDAYQRVAERRPWWKGMESVPADQREWIRFCTGGFYLARTQFLRDHDIPDAGMVMQYEDTLLGDLVHHVGGRMVEMPAELLSLVSISDGDRRWSWTSGRNEIESGSPAPIAATAADSDTQSRPEATLRRAIAAHQRGQLGDAELFYREALSLDPRMAHTWHLLAAAVHAAGRTAEAQILVRRAIRLHPSVAEYYNALGVYLAALKQHPAAAASFHEATRLDPDLADAARNLQLAHLATATVPPAFPFHPPTALH